MKVTYLAVTFGFAIPMLLGILADIYIFMPIRYSSSNDALVIHVSEVKNVDIFSVCYIGFFIKKLKKNCIYLLNNKIF